MRPKVNQANLERLNNLVRQQTSVPPEALDFNSRLQILLDEHERLRAEEKALY